MKNIQATTSVCALLAGGALIVAIMSAGCASEKAGIAAPAPTTPVATGKSDLPAPAPASIQGAMIYVAADSSVIANGKKIKPEEAAGRLRKASIADDTEIKLRSHPGAPFNTVVAVMRNLRESGYTRVSLVVDTTIGKAEPQPMDK